MKASAPLLILLAFLLGACSPSKSSDALLGTASPEPDPFGTNGNSAILFTPLDLDFGVTRTMNQSTIQNLQVQNVAAASVYITTVGDQTNQNFQIVSHDCPTGGLPLTSNSICTIRLRFTPQSVGSMQWTFRLRFGRGPGGTEYIAYTGVRGTGATDVIFSGLDSIDQVRSKSARLNWTDTTGENGYSVFRVNGSGALEFVKTVSADATSTVVTGLTPATTYKFRVRALDLFGQYENNAVEVTTTTLPQITLTAQEDRLMTTTSGELVVGQASSFDFNNTAPGGAGDDVGMTYTCFYDQVLDGVVASTSACSTLSGLTLHASFSSNGQFTWTPVAGVHSQRTYEIRVSGSDGSDEAPRIFRASVRDPYVRTNLLAEYAAAFVTSGARGLNSPLTLIWENLKAAAQTLNLTLAGTFSVGWTGTGEDGVSPFRLVFDGGAAGSRATSAIPAPITTSFAFNAWLKPTQATPASEAWVLGAPGTGTDGWLVKQKTDGTYQLALGEPRSYNQVVLSQSPSAYFQFEESGGTTLSDSSGNGQHGTITTSTGLSMSQLGQTGNSFRFTGNSYVSLTPIDINDTSKTWTLSVWIKTPLPNDGAWKTVTRGSTGCTDHHIIFQQSTNEFGSYFGCGGNFFGSGVMANSLSAGWHLFTVVGTGTSTRYYVDGGFVSSTTLMAYSDFFSIGNYSGGGQPAYDLDGMGIWTRALSDAEVQDQFRRTCEFSLFANSWAMLSGSFSGGTAKLFRNGSKICEFTPHNPSISPPENLVVGAKADGSQAWAGELSQLQIFSSLSEADITTSFLATYKRYFKDPRMLPNLALWYDASDPLGTGSAPANGAQVAVWMDRSGNGRDADSTGSTSTPTFSSTGFGGSPSIYYNGTAYHHSPYTVGGGAYTVILVAALEGTQNSRVLGDWSGQNVLFGYWNNVMDGFYFNNDPENLFTGVGTRAATTERQRYIFTKSSSTGSFKMYRGRNLHSSRGASPATLFKPSIGCGHTGMSECSKVHVSEVIIYDRELASDEMEMINAYLEGKWGF